MRLSPRSADRRPFLVLPAGLAQPALAQKDPEATVAKSLEVLSEITRNPKTGMPRLVMKQGAGDRRHPRHVQDELHLRRPIRPGRAVGAPAGRHLEQSRLHPPDGRQLRGPGRAQSTDLVLVFQTQKGLDRFLKGERQAHAGGRRGRGRRPVGKHFEASTDAGLKSEILSYSNTRGIFAGVSAEGGTLQIDWRANTLYYGQPVSPAADPRRQQPPGRSRVDDLAPAVAGRENGLARAHRPDQAAPQRTGRRRGGFADLRRPGRGRD